MSPPGSNTPDQRWRWRWVLPALLIASAIVNLVQTPVQITALPPYPKGKAVRWNLWINRAIRDELATLAAKRDISPSQLVQELLWTALNDR